MIPYIKILSREGFQYKIQEIEKLDNHFCISIMDPIQPAIRDDSEIYRTYSIYDVDCNVGGYSPITWDQATDMWQFIKSNLGKDLYVHCGAGISRSGAVAEFYYEYFGGDYKNLKKKYPFISPNPKILYYLREVSELC